MVLPIMEDASSTEQYGNDHHALTLAVLERVGLVISSAAKDTPYEVEVKHCVVEELNSVRKGEFLTKTIYTTGTACLRHW